MQDSAAGQQYFAVWQQDSATQLEVKSVRDIRRCAVCNKTFVTSRVNTICCSDACKYSRRLQTAKENRERILKQETKAVERKKKTARSITEIAVASREAGMTYGQYVSMMGM